MEKLTNEQIIEICDKVIESIESADMDNELVFLCNETQSEIADILGVSYQEVEEINSYIPEFTYQNAEKYANAKICYRVWWYGETNGRNFNYSDRIKFMEWIKSQYQNK